MNKTCNVCKRDLPADVVHFHRRKASKDRLSYTCKECLGGTFGVKRFNQVFEKNDKTKICTSCKSEFPKTGEHFDKHKGFSDGFRATCKKCRSEMNKRYREKNKEAINHKNKTYRENNKEKIRNFSKEYYKQNKDALREKKKIYQQENKEKLNLRRRLYRKENIDLFLKREKINREKYVESVKKARRKWDRSPEGLDYKRRYTHARRAKLKKLDYDFSLNDWEKAKKAFDFLCAYCGSEENLTHEHFIPLSKNGNYTTDNIIPSCGSCNYSKSDSDFYEWYPKQSFYSVERQNKIIKYLESQSRLKHTN